jgi:hypothetical protein
MHVENFLMPMGQEAEFGYDLYLVMCYWPQCRILCTMFHSTEFYYALWAIVQSLVIPFGPQSYRSERRITELSLQD